MEHIAVVLDKSPIDVRLANMDPVQNERTIHFLKELQTKSDFDARKREIEKYNLVRVF